MGLDFLKNYQGQSLREHPPSPLPDRENADTGKPEVRLDLELAAAQWKPVETAPVPAYLDQLPRRFIDGCHLAETVSWLRDGSGHPIPVMLAEIGSVAVALENRRPVREFSLVQRILCLILEPFPWHDVEEFARDLRVQLDYRLVGAGLPEEGIGHDFERLRGFTHNRSTYEMAILEQLALIQKIDTPTLVDGPLEIRLRGHNAAPVVGAIKQHRERYVDDHGANVLLDLQPGQRTPAFQIDFENLPVVSWYLRLVESRGGPPNHGLIRVEITAEYFRTLADPFAYINGLSHYLRELRCRQQGYRRAPVSLDPIVWAEHSLKSEFVPMNMLTSRFYHVTGL